LFNTTERVWLLNNAIDLEKYLEIAKNNKEYWSTLRKVKGLKLIQVGRLNDVKNHQFSLEIAKNLKNKGVEFTFFIVGQGPLESFLKTKVKEYSLTDYVYFLGVRDDVAELMAGADLMLMPSLHEGFPVVLVESQAIGINAIVSDHIANEVDLGIGLITFVSIDEENSVQKWCDVIDKADTIKNDRDKVISSDFDAKKNALDLLNFYNQMK